MAQACVVNVATSPRSLWVTSAHAPLARRSHVQSGRRFQPGLGGYAEWQVAWIP